MLRKLKTYELYCKVGINYLIKVFFKNAVIDCYWVYEFDSHFKKVYNIIL